MNFNVNLLLIIVCYLLVGCTSVPNEMVVAERIMETHPDSALNILQKLKPEKYLSNSNRALYGLLLFQALEMNKLPLNHDSILDFSLYYYLNKNNKSHLMRCYFYKGRICKTKLKNDEAIKYYLKAIDNSVENKNDFLLGQIYSDLGDISFYQHEYIKARMKYKISVTNFNRAGNKKNSYFRILDLGRTYQAEKDYIVAQRYYKFVLNKSSDSIILGSALQEIGICFNQENKLDSAEYYLNKSMNYPFFNSSDYGIRCYILSDLYYKRKKYDLAFNYATEALKYKVNYYTQRECFRILVNVEYLKNNIDETAKYMLKYQSCINSIQTIESQPKSTDLEKIHYTNKEVHLTQRKMVLIVSVLIVIVSLLALLEFYLYKQYKIKKDQLYVFKQELTNNQKLYSESLSKNITDIRLLQTGIRKKASLPERDLLDKKMYQHALKLYNWDDFKLEMNHTFNDLVDKLDSKCPSITHKEITWCCMQLLDIPHADRMVLLEASSDSLYKLKQRLAHKLNLKSTKELDIYIINEINLTHQY